jgi:modulator of FtsH protease HflK
MVSSSWIRRAALAAVVLFWLSSAFWTVQQDQTGLVHRFGAVQRTVGPGFHLSLPWPIERIDKIATGVSRTMPVGFTYLEQLGAENLDPTRREWLTGDTNIVKMEVTLYYTITDPVKYMYGMSEPSGGLMRDMVLRRLAEAAMTESIASMGIDEVLSTGKTQLRNEVLGRVQAQIEDFRLGITLTSFNLTEVGPPPEVQNAFNEVTSAKAYKDQQLSEAQGARATALPFARAEANRLVQQAESDRTVIVSEAEGWADAFRALASSMQTHRAVGMKRLWLQSVERLLAASQVIILPRLPAGTTAPLYLPD